LSRLGIGGYTAGVIIADHNNDARTKNCKQREQLRFPGTSTPLIVMGNSTEGAVNCLVFIIALIGGHCSPPLLLGRRSRFFEHG
jgi:hypothetical protein